MKRLYQKITEEQWSEGTLPSKKFPIEYDPPDHRRQAEGQQYPEGAYILGLARQGMVFPRHQIHHPLDGTVERLGYKHQPCGGKENPPGSSRKGREKKPDPDQDDHQHLDPEGFLVSEGEPHPRQGVADILEDVEVGFVMHRTLRGSEWVEF